MQVGLGAPCLTVIRQWKRAVTGCSPEAFIAFRRISESEDRNVDASAITLSILSANEYISAKSKPGIQAITLHIVSR